MPNAHRSARRGIGPRLEQLRGPGRRIVVNTSRCGGQHAGMARLSSGPDNVHPCCCASARGALGGGPVHLQSHRPDFAKNDRFGAHTCAQGGAESARQIDGNDHGQAAAEALAAPTCPLLHSNHHSSHFHSASWLGGKYEEPTSICPPPAAGRFWGVGR